MVLGFTRTRAKAASEKGVSGIDKVEPPLLKTRHRFIRKGKKENLFSPVK
jgi:hypothetical protein